MNAIKRYWIDFAAWVKGRNRRLQVQTVQPIPVESWAERKLAFERSRRAHRGQAHAYAHLRKATYDSLKRDVISRLDREDAAIHVLIESHPWLYARDPEAFDAAIKAIARRRVAEARR
jgi:hypothetical protein